MSGLLYTLNLCTDNKKTWVFWMDLPQKTAFPSNKNYILHDVLTWIAQTLRADTESPFSLCSVLIKIPSSIGCNKQQQQHDHFKATQHSLYYFKPGFQHKTIPQQAIFPLTINKISITFKSFNLFLFLMPNLIQILLKNYFHCKFSLHTFSAQC